MSYTAALDFFLATVRRCRIPVQLSPADEMPSTRFDLGLRHQLGWDADYEHLYHTFFEPAKTHIIYKLRDSFECHYRFLRLPDERLLLIGPFLTEEMSDRLLLEQAELLSLSPSSLQQQERYYRTLPVLNDTHALFALLDTLGETLWGNTGFTVVDINQLIDNDAVLAVQAMERSPDDTIKNMEILEQRYYFENELIQAVAQGLSHKAELLLSRVAESSMEQRLSDSVRNVKNYCIIMNTLSRKAAESGGVHPVYLDRASTEFARRIELLPTVNATQPLMRDMFLTYCRLVRTAATKQYSQAVQRALVCIDADISGDLNLRTLAAMQNLNASYLSAIFRRETGKTVTEHITERRMERAKRLLRSTQLQIQTVAQYCGIPDSNYFSKLFKEHTGKTPRAYRSAVPRAEASQNNKST